MYFTIIGAIEDPETIATGTGVRARKRLRRVYGGRRWRKRPGFAMVKLPSGEIHLAEIHWYEASGVGRRPDSLRVVGLELAVTGDAGLRTTQATLEGRGDTEWVLIHIAARADRAFRFHAERRPESLVSMDAFRNARVGTAHLAVLGWGLLAWVVAIAAAVRTLRRRTGRRWVWAVLSFVMVGPLGLDWTTGALSFWPLTVVAPPISLMKAGPAEPWMISVGVPVFAVIALWKAARPQPDERPEQAAPAVPSP